MKLVDRSGDRLTFSLAAREKVFLERLVSFYPLDPEPHTALSRTGGESLADAEAVLRAALRELRQELSGWLKLRLAEGDALAKSGNAWRLVLDAVDTERLLQVLNELRVSAWIKLGRPDDLAEGALALTPASVPFHAILILSGQFQMVLIQALHGDSPYLPPSEI